MKRVFDLVRSRNSIATTAAEPFPPGEPGGPLQAEPDTVPMTPKVPKDFDYGSSTSGVQVPSQPRFVPMLAQGHWPAISDGFDP